MDGFLVLYRTSSTTLSALILVLLDVVIGGISRYLILSRIPYGNAILEAAIVSAALSTVNVTLMTVLDEFFQTLKKGKQVKLGDVAVAFFTLVVTFALWAGDMFIDMMPAELIVPPASGNIFMFLTRTALTQYPRPNLWWVVAIMFGLLSSISEILVERTVRGNVIAKKRTSPRHRASYKRGRRQEW